MAAEAAVAAKLAGSGAIAAALKEPVLVWPWQTVPAVVGAALPRECQDFPGGNFLVFSWQLQLLSLPKLLQRLLCNSQTQGDQVLKQSLNNFRSKMSSIAVYKHEILVQYLDFITRYIQYGAIKNQEKNYHF